MCSSRQVPLEEGRPSRWFHEAHVEPEGTADLGKDGPAASAFPRRVCGTKRKLTAACLQRREKPREMGRGVQMLTGKEGSVEIGAMPCTE